jgi:hypothetical protein
MINQCKLILRFILSRDKFSYTSKWCELNSTQFTSIRSELNNTVNFQKVQFNSDIDDLMWVSFWCELKFRAKYVFIFVCKFAIYWDI